MNEADILKSKIDELTKRVAALEYRMMDKYVPPPTPVYPWNTPWVVTWKDGTSNGAP